MVGDQYKCDWAVVTNVRSVLCTSSANSGWLPGCLQFLNQHCECGWWFQSRQRGHNQAWKGNSHLYSQGACELPGITEAMFYNWGLKPEAGMGGDGGKADPVPVLWPVLDLCCLLGAAWSGVPFRDWRGLSSGCWVSLRAPMMTGSGEWCKGKQGAAL